jgi:death-on-curing protein
MIDDSGGLFMPPDNLLNRNSLVYILDAIARPIYGHELFPTPKEKAAALGFEIIASHVFFDGNKRTGIYMAWAFLQWNGIRVVLDHSIEDLAVDMASSEADRDDLLEWLHDHQPEDE